MGRRKSSNDNKQKEKYQKPTLKKAFIEPLIEQGGEFEDNIVVGSYEGACATSE